jgi:hypothetical protein
VHVALQLGEDLALMVAVDLRVARGRREQEQGRELLGHDREERERVDSRTPITTISQPLGIAAQEVDQLR